MCMYPKYVPKQISSKYVRYLCPLLLNGEIKKKGDIGENYQHDISKNQLSGYLLGCNDL